MPYPRDGGDEPVDDAGAESPDELVTLLLPHMYRQASKLAPRERDDVVQEACVKLLTRPYRLTDHPTPRAYALRCVTTVAYDRLRAADRVAFGDVPDVPTFSIVEAEAVWQVEWLLGFLPRRQAQSVFLIDVCGLGLQESARILRVHWGTVARSRDRGLRALRPVVDGNVSTERRRLS